MRIPFVSLFATSPFEGLMEHAEKVKECSLYFQQAMECFLAENCTRFEEFRNEVLRLEEEADAVKRRIRGHIPKGTLLAVDKFQLFMYLKEQDKVLDSVEDTLDWISFRPDIKIDSAFVKDINILVDTNLKPIEELSLMVIEAKKYFSSFSEKDRVIVKEIIRTLRQQEHDSDNLEKALKRKAFATIQNPIDVFFIVRLVEQIGAIADHAENAGDMMRAMIAK